MASSLHTEMQCSSLPQVSGNRRFAIPLATSSDLGPQASTHRRHPVHCSAEMIGIHLYGKLASSQALRTLAPTKFHIEIVRVMEHKRYD